MPKEYSKKTKINTPHITNPLSLDKKVYQPPVLFALHEEKIQGGNTKSIAENTSGQHGWVASGS